MKADLIVNLKDVNVRYDVERNVIYVAHDGRFPKLLTVVGSKSSVDFILDQEKAEARDFWDGEYIEMIPVNNETVLKIGVRVVVGRE